MSLSSVNPFTGATLAEYSVLTTAELDARIALAGDAALPWRFTSVDERIAVVRRLGELLETEKERLGRLMTLEMGKPIRAAVEEAAKCALGCRFYAEHGASFIADEAIHDDARRSFVAYEPLGVVLAIMPWNFPFWQVVRFLAPALVAGNVALLKHASNVPQCALELESLVRRAGAPDGVFQTLLVESDAVAGIIADSRVSAVTLTGSEAAGRSVGRTAGGHLKPAVLELGGSDPFIIMPSADIRRAVDSAVRARTINNGQSCIAAKRFIVHRDVADQFLDGFVGGMGALRSGDPLDPETELGPLASVRAATELEDQVAESVRLGASLLLGGSRTFGDGGAFFPATVLVDPPPESPAYRDEMFGPVGVVFIARDATDAIRIANDTRFGLGASAWTTDPDEQERFVRELDAGSVFINDMVVSDPRFPFGGIKSSGYGRELGAHGLRAFTNIKTVRVKRGGATSSESTDTE
ncbi:MAG: NAD-dependent succinate-semialdehyde dehydrogenase [Gemmatimonadaceae bacterium]|nr:NAD-dependent succinate-semialdehyde dehydrogenase [Gemmatimonadaceae bacterium]